MKTVVIHLGYFKQGDDLDACIEMAGGNPIEGIYNHLALIDDVKNHLSKIIDIVEKYNHNDITINADAHAINITGPDKMIKELQEQDLVEVYIPQEREEV